MDTVSVHSQMGMTAATTHNIQRLRSSVHNMFDVLRLEKIFDTRQKKKQGPDARICKHSSDKHGHGGDQRELFRTVNGKL